MGRTPPRRATLLTEDQQLEALADTLATRIEDMRGVNRVLRRLNQPSITAITHRLDAELDELVARLGALGEGGR